MVSQTRSALVPRNKDDNADYKESKEDDPEALTAASSKGGGVRVGLPDRRSTKPTEQSGKARRTTQVDNGGTTLPRPPIVNRNNSSDKRIPRYQESGGSSPKLATTMNRNKESVKAAAPSWTALRDPVEQEQALFEQRLCEDTYGVAVRKINQHGKANLRYVKCVSVEELDSHNKSSRSVSSRSVNSWGRRKNSEDRTQSISRLVDSERAKRALIWGKKKGVQITLDKFTSVRKGKTTDRARRNSSPASRVLSIMTNDPNHSSLDIEAPTRLDRDKFARAFAKFLEIPLEGSDDNQSVRSAELPAASSLTRQVSLSKSEPGDAMMRIAAIRATTAVKPTQPVPVRTEAPKADETWKAATANEAAIADPKIQEYSSKESSTNQETNRDSSQENMLSIVPVTRSQNNDPPIHEDDEGSEMSSLTGHGYDQEIVEELHHALNDLRAELEESRAEAARAVKVAEQAIQSAEKSNSLEWQNTVTHKAAEAAAIAQKQSAEAMAKQRLAEERLESERRTAAFWRKQAEVAEEEAGALQTRAAAAEVQRAAMDEHLESERRMSVAQIDALKSRFLSNDAHQREALEAALERNRALELELDAMRRDWSAKTEFQENEENVGESTNARNGMRKKLSLMGRKKKAPDARDSTMLLSGNVVSSSSTQTDPGNQIVPVDGQSQEQFLRIQAEYADVRKQFELLRRATAEELQTLPQSSRNWAEQVSQALNMSHAETQHLRERLAIESAVRRKLLHEVQDLRGVVRVYCRPKPLEGDRPTQLFSLPSQQTLILHREKFSHVQESVGPLSFEFDRIFQHGASQKDVYSEFEDVCLGVLDGYNICVMAYGQTCSGKTYTLLGDVEQADGCTRIENSGVQLQAMQQLFTIADHRSERYKDTFTLSIVEVYNERLCDLIAGTMIGEARGQIMTAGSTKAASRRKSTRSSEDDSGSGKPSKLEIRTDVHGDTVVQGALSVEVESFEEVCQIWEEALALRKNRISEQEMDPQQYEASSHVIATLKVVSANIATGLGSIGKLQFVDLAGADLLPRRLAAKAAPTHDGMLEAVGNHNEWRYAHRSLETLSEVIAARSKYDRSVPYRNSTLTHLLRDSLEADTKVILIACVSSDPKYLQETASSLRFASTMRGVTVGKATKHTLSPP